MAPGGSIPACAGEALASRPAVNHAKVYPRVCGGSASASLAWRSMAGLSPRVRGKRLIWRCWRTLVRSIPACAGEASPVVGGISRAPVYPRVCGGSSYIAFASLPCAGLSPRVRGKPPTRPQPTSATRSIPACAGEAAAGMTPGRVAAVYPRVCGGSNELTAADVKAAGLSPRVRGKLDAVPPEFYYPGSIPACAGEADRDARLVRCRGVYPRVCGGSLTDLDLGDIARGLSPRVRGKPPMNGNDKPRTRSIPACAGEATPGRPFSPPRKVYPRVCGGSGVDKRITALLGGLSPRVRGKHAIKLPNGMRWGSIPACAGEASLPRIRCGGHRVYPRVCGGSALTSGRMPPL